MRLVRLVAARELAEAFRSRTYWFTMAVLLAAVAAAVAVPRLLGGDARHEVGLAGDAPAGLRADLREAASAAGIEVTVVPLRGRARAEEAVREDAVDAALVYAGGRPALLRRARTPESLVAVAGQAAALAGARERLGGAGVEAGVVREALAGGAAQEALVDEGQEGRAAVAYAVGLVLYLAIFMGGMSVATGVAVEKSTRIAEVLVIALRPAHLLAGKVAGVGLSTLILLAAGAVPLTGAVLAGLIDVPAAAALDVVGGIGWFLLGYAIYATAFAALGALVDRQEDLGGAVGPVIGALVVSYLAAIQAQADPAGALARATSLIPLSAPVVMPVRLAEGAAGAAEVVAAVAIGLVTLLALVRLAEVVYRRALLRGGRRLRLTEVLRG